MTKRYDVCTVDTPTETYVKARAVLHANALEVLDRRHKLLFRIEAEPVEESRHITRFGDVTVRNMPGACGCGGLRVVTKSTQPEEPR